MGNDLVERQAAIDALGDEPEVWTGKDEYAMGLNNQWHYDRNAIKAVPCAQPETEERTLTEDDYAYCMNCDHGEMCRWYPMYGCEFKSRPSAQPERKTGKWVRHYSRPNVYADLCWHCSNCGYKTPDNWANKWKFCPNCGARMVQEGEEP